MFRHGSERFDIVVIPASADDDSAPAQVLDRLDDEVRKRGIEDGDETWLVLDVDRWNQPGHIANLTLALQQAVQKGHQLALSNPCFECWLIMHFTEPPSLPQRPSLSSSYKSELRKILGAYNEANLDVERFRPRIADAVARAERYDTPPADRIPRYPGSHVYKLVCKLV
jgi:hypothetical protein